MDQKEVDLESLSIQQLDEIRKQIELELNHLTNSFTKLKQAQFKFQECKNSICLLSKEGDENKEMLVPLTSSLYVSGILASKPEKVMIDIGTGYYVEKTIEEAIKFYEERVKYLNTNLKDIEGYVNSKSSSLKVVIDVIQEKIKNSEISVD
ncbi:hypothetical protein PMAC_002816 [Pneumocystis sp. 'macacae']|nr:hypothetical protein PMAC_002816 [Pneumocystis sp. 'macacae']